MPVKRARDVNANGNESPGAIRRLNIDRATCAGEEIALAKQGNGTLMSGAMRLSVKPFVNVGEGAEGQNLKPEPEHQAGHCDSASPCATADSTCCPHVASSNHIGRARQG
jgi:hypothetical protein